MTVTVRPAGPGDLELLFRIQRDTVLVAYRYIFPPEQHEFPADAAREEWRAALVSSTSRTAIAEVGGAPVGTVSLDPPRLERLFVLPARWRAGIGGVLHEWAIAELGRSGVTRAELVVLEQNDRARRFYEARGWAPIGPPRPSRYPPYPGTLTYARSLGRDSRDSRDWVQWHEPYEDPASPLSRRLAIVQRHIRAALDAAPPDPVRVVSMCAGQGRDILGVLEGHPRRADVVGCLVELDPHNAALARRAATDLGLDGVEVVTGDAALTDAYAGAVPADLVLACGIFGNISDADIEHTVEHLPMLVAPGAVVIWTRHRKPPDLTPAIRDWFGGAGFNEIAFEAPEGIWQSVGVNRWAGDPPPFHSGVRLFTFL